MYQHLRLWFWWNYIVNKDEFSPRLNYWYLYDTMKKKKPYSVDLLNASLTRQRHLAHELDMGKKIRSINPHYIRQAKI
jgi:hypothetical protein